MRLALHRREVPESIPRARPAHARGSAPDKADEQYAGAFARVRLVRAWIGVAAATVALCYAFAKLLDHLVP